MHVQTKLASEVKTGHFRNTDNGFWSAAHGKGSFFLKPENINTVVSTTLSLRHCGSYLWWMTERRCLRKQRPCGL